MEGHEVTSVDDLYKFLAEWPVDNSVKLTVIRGQQRIELEVVPVEPAFSVK